MENTKRVSKGGPAEEDTGKGGEPCDAEGKEQDGGAGRNQGGAKWLSAAGGCDFWKAALVGIQMFGHKKPSNRKPDRVGLKVFSGFSFALPVVQEIICSKSSAVMMGVPSSRAFSSFFSPAYSPTSR